ncbi:hypothetical protein TWF481_011597 [Arthrobotrys musiformis]|uniref:C2H2-type domain-containing protein n=1 Tax=Arthrobotrys musiformis TaxID=47236 RepID=A0AAV9VYX8_9PEZI
MGSIRQNGHVQQPFTYANAAPAAPTENGATYSTVQFSDPWKGGANPNHSQYAGLNGTPALATSQGDLTGLKQSLRQNSVSSSFDQLSLNMQTTRALPSQILYQTDFIPTAAPGFPASYPDQTTMASPTARATPAYGMSAYGSYEPTPKNNLQSSLIDYSRPAAAPSTYHTADTIDATRGMLALNQPPRISLPHVGAHGHRNSSSAASSNSYYPQSTTSSISSASSYPYYPGSLDSNTDMSLADIYDSARPNLPRIAGHHSIYGHHQQSGQASMMGQFNSRVQTNTTKKHKCKICDKRFTRPSSLQTHMYSHTGEKPFACEVEGCGRQFSVVSNLRRHRKVHKPNNSDTETISNAGSV